jgi:hypothetical protein
MERCLSWVDILHLSVAVCIQEMAVLSSATACAPITSHTTTPGSVPNIATCVIDQATVNTGSATGQQTPAHEKPTNKLAEKFHGLTEKLHSLGHHRSDSDTSTRTRTGTTEHISVYYFLFIYLFIRSFIHSFYGVGLRLWTVVSNGYIFHPRMIWVWRAMVEWYWQGKTEELGEKPVPVQLCRPQIPHGLTRSWTQASAVTSQRLTVWVMAPIGICVLSVLSLA